MSKELEAFKNIKREAGIPYFSTLYDIDMWREDLSIVENALKEKEINDFELQVFKLAYEWKCNGYIDSYEELLEKARRTVQGWKEIERKGYGTITG